MSRAKGVGKMDEALGAGNIRSLDGDRCPIDLDRDFDLALCVAWRNFLFVRFEEVLNDRLDALEQFNKEVFVLCHGVTCPHEQGESEE